MMLEVFSDNPYILLTPGPLSTTKSVKAAMLQDWCTWDDDYNNIVQEVRSELLTLATDSDDYTTVLMQGSGTFSVEATLGSTVPDNGRLLILTNGAYGERIRKIAERLKIDHIVHDSGETAPPNVDLMRNALEKDEFITHIVVVHCETTTGMLNPIDKIASVAKEYDKVLIVDAMSSFAGIPIDVKELGIDFLISSANKCIQGVPGFGFVIARKQKLESCKGYARSLSLDLYDQWQTMKQHHGKWRYTSPTHVVFAFRKALEELKEEGGIKARYQRYQTNQKILVSGMESLGFTCLLKKEYHSPIITSFYNPPSDEYDFMKFYELLKRKGFVIYPGKVSTADTFRIGNIGHVFPEDINRLIHMVKESMYWR